MKNKYNLLLIIAIMVFVIGCSCGGLDQFVSQDKPSGQSPNSSNKTVTDQVTDVATTGEKIGIQECDDLMDYFRSKIESDNTDFVTKAVLKTLEARFREGIKQNLDENKADKVETAKWCKEFKKQLDEQEAKQKK